MNLYFVKEEIICYRTRLVNCRYDAIISTEMDLSLEPCHQPLADSRVHLSHLFPDRLLERVEGHSLPAFLIDCCLQEAPKVLYWGDLWWIWRVCRFWYVWNVELIIQITCLLCIVANGKVRPEVEVIIIMKFLQERDEAVFTTLFMVQFTSDWDFLGDNKRFWHPPRWNAYPHHQLLWILALGHEPNIFWHLRQGGIPKAIVATIPRSLVIFLEKIALVIHYDFSHFGRWKKLWCSLLHARWALSSWPGEYLGVVSLFLCVLPGSLSTWWTWTCEIPNLFPNCWGVAPNLCFAAFTSAFFFGGNFDGLAPDPCFLSIGIPCSHLAMES